jgi:Ricin-type beta-trefoil lectin domain-like
MPFYTFRLDQFQIVNPRSGGPFGGTDTDTASLTLKVGNQIFGTLLRSMGGVQQGWHPVGIEFPNISIDDPQTMIFLNFVIVNAGNANPDNLKPALANAGSVLAGADPPFDVFLTPDLPPEVGLLNTAGIAAFDVLAGLLGVDCDGTVVKHQICGSRSSFDNTFAAGTRTVTRTIAMPGDPSPVGCGDTSLYKVTLTWIRTDDQPVRGSDPDSTFLILSRASGLVLDIPDASNNPGVQIQQFPENGGGNQKWKLVPVQGNYWNTQSVSSGLVLDVEHSSGDNHARILQWPNNGGRNQQWEFDLVQDPLGAVDTTFLDAPLTNFSYFKVRCRNSGKVMDVPSSQSNPNILIQQYDDNNGFNQHWQLIRV